jgi:tetratricopeptide (TPR) repeat protein
MSDQFYLSKDEEISPQSQETLLQIASMIRLSEGFRLGFVKCNQPIVRSRLVSRLKEMLAGEADIVIVELKEPVSSLRRSVLEALNKQSSSGKRAIMVFGFEHSVPSHGPAPSLDELNMSRDSFPGSFSDPVMIWLPDYALTRLAREAPDFWGWRSGVFEFPPEQKLMAFAEKTILQNARTDGLSLIEKRERAAALDGLIEDYREMKRGERENKAFAEILRDRAYLRYLLGQYDEARRLYGESLKINRDLGDKRGEAITLHQMGNLAYVTGDLAEARCLYSESLKIKQDLGDKNSMAGTLHQMGILAHDTGDLSEARRLYGESLKIAQDVGDESGVAMTLHQMGNLAYATGDLSEARRLYGESLKILQDLGDKSGVSRSLHQLGMLAQDTGDCNEARRLYEQSLKIKQDLGDKSGVAITLAQTSLLEEKEGRLSKALELIRQAERSFLELGSPMAAQAKNVRERLEKKQGQS